MNRLLFITAAALSATAAFYSVTGLMTIFAAAPLSIAIMGSVLEFSKLVVASWLWRNWEHTRVGLKTYLTTAVILLICLTSLGTYAYLSAAHSTATGSSAAAIAQLERIDARLRDHESELTRTRGTIAQLDGALNEIISRSTGETSVQRALTIRKSQAAERRELAATVTALRDKIAALQTEREPLAAAVRTVETKTGPLRYIARLAGSDTPASLDTAIRLLILLIVAVFDPLAVLMFIAYNQSTTREQTEPESSTQDRPPEPIIPQPDQPVMVQDQLLEPPASQPEPDQPPELDQPPEPTTPQPYQPPVDWERDRKLEPLP